MATIHKQEKLTVEQAVAKIRQWMLEEEQAGRRFSFEVQVSRDEKGYDVKQRQWRR